MAENEIETPVAEEAPAPEEVAEATEPEGVPETELDATALAVDASATEDTERLRFQGLVEALVYVTEEPLSVTQIAQALNRPVERVQQALADLMAAGERADRGLAIREVAGGFKMGTKPEYHEEIRTFVKKLKPPLKLSLAALETLAVIAYKQPITSPEIMDVRGVQGAGVLKTLLERKLITAAGRKQVVGRPVLYKTTKEFLVQFGLKDLAELPSLKEFEEWSRLALGEPDSTAEPAAESAPEPVAETTSEAPPAEAPAADPEESENG